LLGAFVLFLVRRFKGKNPGSYFLNKFKRVDSDGQPPAELGEAQKRIRALQKKISALKNQDKIKEVQKHILREQEEIDRLKKGD